MSKILVVDDSIAVRKVAERLLMEAGFEVVLAANGEEALAHLAKDGVDVIVCDVIMPDKSGYEICTYVRDHPQLAAIPVLLMSGIVNDEVIQQAQSCQADGVLKKPFQGTCLQDKVRELVEMGPRKVLPPSAEPEVGSTQSTDESSEEKSSFQDSDVPVSVLPSEADRQLPPDGMREKSRDEHELAVLADRLKEVEALLCAERARAEGLADRVSELERDVRAAQEAERLLEEERRRANELQSKVDDLERELSRIPQLETLLREAQESAATARREAAALKRAEETIAQLEAALHTEQASAAQLVQQMTELEQEVARGKSAESMLAREREQVADLERKNHEAEAALLAMKTKLTEVESELEAERRKTEDYERRLADLEARATKTQGLKVLLSAERERSAEIAQKLAETEWVAMNTTRRLEEIGAKLRDIASMALELSKGIGERESAK